MINDRNDPSGSQFYGVSTTQSVENLNRAHTVAVDDLVGTGSGALFAGTGGILSDTSTGQPVDILNPFLTLNYLIYAGEEG